MGKYYKVISADPTSKYKLITINENIGHINGFFGYIKYILQVSSIWMVSFKQRNLPFLFICVLSDVYY